jgi:1-aminocyclopropane-1-carboxylate deaminase/D-cysteine desulfhydrase-like pyridoxal-dependent ACC family enzyme
VSKTLRETSASLFRLQQKLKGEACRIKRQEMQEEILRLQQTLKTDLEAKDTASRMRISNFYKTGIGKMQPETFYCIKNVNRGRDINSLRHEGAV